MVAEVATALAGLGGLGAGVITTLGAGLFGRRKAKADATEVLTQAAANLVEPLSTQLAAVTREFAEHRRAAEQTETRRRVAAAQHKVWDEQVAASLRALGEQVAPPPPLEDI